MPGNADASPSIGASDRGNAPAVNPEVRTRYVTRAVGGQEDDRRGNVLGLAEPTKGDAALLGDEALDRRIAIDSPLLGQHVDDAVALRERRRPGRAGGDR